MQIIPLQNAPNQAVRAALGGQNCQVNVYQKSTGLFLDLYVDDNLIIGGVLGRNLRLMVINSYLGFVGDLIWLDNHGTDDPNYAALVERFSLIYLTPSEIPSGYVA